MKKLLIGILVLGSLSAFAGSNIDVKVPKNCDDYNLLLNAVVSGNDERVTSLILRGINANVQCQNGRTALMVAVGRRNNTIVKNLLKNGANPNTQDSDDGDTALRMAARDGQIEITNLLIKYGADVNLTDIYGRNALLGIFRSNAIWFVPGSYDIVKILIENGTDLNVQDNEGISALMLAVDKNVSSMVKLLVSKGANLNLRTTYNGTSALKWAVIDDNSEDLSRLLLENGALPYQVTPENEFSWDFSLERGDEFKKLFSEYSNELAQNHLILAVIKKQSSAIVPLAQTGIDIDAQDTTSRTALIYAVVGGDVESIKILRGLGANLNILDDQNKSAINYAIESGNEELIRALTLKL
jgi:ankyrin repeat protein